MRANRRESQLRAWETTDEACLVLILARTRARARAEQFHRTFFAAAASESGLEHAPSNHEEGRAMHGRGPLLARFDPVDKAARS